MEKIIYDNGVPQTRIIFIFFVYILIHNLANKSLFGLKISQMILNTETNNLMYNWSFLFAVLHKPTLLPSTFNTCHHLTKGAMLSTKVWRHQKYFFSIFMIFFHISVEHDEKPPHTKFGGNRFMGAQDMAAWIQN